MVTTSIIKMKENLFYFYFSSIHYYIYTIHSSINILIIQNNIIEYPVLVFPFQRPFLKVILRRIGSTCNYVIVCDSSSNINGSEVLVKTSRMEIK